MSFTCIFHVYLLLELIKEKEDLGSIEFGPHCSLRVRGEMTPKLVPGQFLRKRVPKILKFLLASQEKFFVVTHFRNIIGNITISSNRLREIPESLINWFQSSEVKGITRNKHKNFLTPRSSFLLLFL